MSSLNIWNVKNRLWEDIWKNKTQKARFFICENFTLRKAKARIPITNYSLSSHLPIVPIPNHQEDAEYLICMGSYFCCFTSAEVVDVAKEYIFSELRRSDCYHMS